MGKLVDIVLFLNQEINHTFGNPGTSSPAKLMLKSAEISLYYCEQPQELELFSFS